jgi:hypothetical protein
MKRYGSVVSIIASISGIVAVLAEKFWFNMAISKGEDVNWWHPWSKYTFGFLPWFAIVCIAVSLIGFSISVRNKEALQKVSTVIILLWTVIFALLSFTDMFVSSFWSQMLTAWNRWK